MKLMLLGPPGAGKGTQSEILAKKLGVPAISMGHLLRNAVNKKTPMGQQAEEYMDAGKLVPNEIVLKIFLNRIMREDCRDGYILDGVPRNPAQAEELERWGIEIDTVLSIEISDEEIEKRLSGRRSCSKCSASYHVDWNLPEAEGVCDVCGSHLFVRDDDEPHMVRTRLADYYRATAPLKEYYEERGKLIRVNNIHGVAETTAAIFKALGIDL